MSTQRWHVGLLVLNAISRNKDVYHTDVNIICHAENVIKYVDIGGSLMPAKVRFTSY